MGLGTIVPPPSGNDSEGVEVSALSTGDDSMIYIDPEAGFSLNTKGFESISDGQLCQY